MNCPRKVPQQKKMPELAQKKQIGLTSPDLESFLFLPETEATGYSGAGDTGSVSCASVWICISGSDVLEVRFNT